MHRLPWSRRGPGRLTREPPWVQAVASPSIHGLAVVGVPFRVDARRPQSTSLRRTRACPPMGLPLHPPQGEERECVEVVAVALGLTDVCAS